MNLPAGNWDTEFVDSPEAFDVDRNTRGHWAFGYGVHQCIGSQPRPSRNAGRVRHVGAPAARAELAVPPDELRFKEADIYGMKELPVTW